MQVCPCDFFILHAAPGGHCRELPKNCRLSLSVPLRASAQKLRLKRTTAGRRILCTTFLTFFDVLLSMIVLSAAPKSCTSPQKEWLPELQQKRQRRAAMGASLLLLIIFLALLCLYANPLRLFAKSLVLKGGRISEMRKPLQQSVGYLRVCAPLTYRNKKEMRCLPVCVVKRLQLGEQRWLRLRSLRRGARPLLLRSRLLAFLSCASPLRLFASATFFKRGRNSEMWEALP